MRVSFHARLRGGGRRVDAFRKDFPGNFLRNGDLRNCFGQGPVHQMPCIDVAIEPPGAAAIATNFELQNRSGFRRHVAVSVGQSAQEAIEDGMVQLPGHNARPADRQTDLLLVVPTLGEFTRPAADSQLSDLRRGNQLNDQ